MSALAFPRLAAALLLAALALPGRASGEPVDVSQGNSIGSGFGFRRGESCTVVTALHVVPEDGIGVSVADRSGARSIGQRTYANPTYDVALVLLPSPTPVACSSRWPDSSWMRAASFTTNSRFEVIRHYPSGARETIILMRFVGRTETTLTLAPVDRMNLRESDSGSIVMFEGKPAGIVQRVDPATDRVEALRWDVVDQLVGTRFRGTAQPRRVALEGIFRNGRAVANWTAYARAWLQETAQAVVVDGSDRQPGCRLRADVLTWEPTRQANPEYTALQERLRTCAAVPVIGRTLCTQLREQMRTVPSQLSGYRVTLDAALTRPSGQRQSKLVTTTHLDRQVRPERDVAERATLEAALGTALDPLFREGACD